MGAQRPGSARTLSAERRGPARAAFPDLVGQAHGARIVRRNPGSVRGSARGPREVSARPSPATGSVGVLHGEKPEVRSPRGEQSGPGTCGKEEWPADCAAGHPPDLVVLWWEGWFRGC